MFILIRAPGEIQRLETKLLIIFLQNFLHSGYILHFIMFEEVYEDFLKLWTEFELQPPEALEVLGITGIAVSSAALFLYLKLQGSKSFKGEFYLINSNQFH